MTFALSTIDIIVIIAYILLMLYIGFVVAKRREQGEHSKEDFILAGRKVTLPVFVATLVATWYGNILGVGEFIFNDGILGWVCFGLPYYIAAALFAWFIAGKIREANTATIPEQIERKFGKKSAWVSSLIVLIITIPAVYILMLGEIVKMFTGWDLFICIVIAAVISLAYIYTGGFKADILTNTAQFVLMYIGFGVLVYFVIENFGGPAEMIEKLPDSHTTPLGTHGWQYVIVWFIIALQTFVDPTFHQRCAAAKTPKTARRGILVSILFWMVFDSMTLGAGLYAKAYLVDLSSPLLAYPALAEAVLPAFWKGIFIVTLLAVIMSTLDSYSFISAVTIGNDIIAPLKRRSGKSKNISEISLTRIGLLITGILGIILATAVPSAIDLIYKTSSIAIPGLLFPLLLSFSSKFTIDKKRLLIVMISGLSGSGIWTLGKELSRLYQYDNIFISVEAMIPGIIISGILSLIFLKKINKVCRSNP